MSNNTSLGMCINRALDGVWNDTDELDLDGVVVTELRDTLNRLETRLRLVLTSQGEWNLGVITQPPLEDGEASA